ncbi:hypothetical protein LM010_05670 [Lacticaseibacillus manihotivorans]|uniref:ScoMcrA-like SRA domain-containing protein n=1 Tax=Lacticaseibacillus manihotivorans TaxID=88233 RepID=A0A5P8JQ87_9LACO|nr:hypothetical protein [Lacticaseibacillus manihotivorans]QFQ90944.1 hypothetical protein LM010_05670 [Lacticaseibacillus manihotivorans]
MIGAWVIHKTYGRGQVIGIDDQQLSVKFEDGAQRQMALSIVMPRGILTFEDDQLQQKTFAEFPSQSHQVAQPVVVSPSKTTHHKRQKSAPKLKRTTALKIADLVSGRVYTHDEIIHTFVVASSGGMRRSHANNALVLLSRHHADPEQNPYEDRWEADGLFHYTGEGQVGDQSLDYRQNKTLNESDRNGISVYLFESSRDNAYVYRGEVVLAKAPYPEQAPDRDGKLWRVYKFPLRVKSAE